VQFPPVALIAGWRNVHGMRKLSTNGLIPRLDKPVDDYRIN